MNGRSCVLYINPFFLLVVNNVHYTLYECIGKWLLVGKNDQKRLTAKQA